MREPPPPPDHSSVSRYSNEVLKEVIYSRSGQRRAVITEDKGQCIRLRFEMWDISDWKEAGRAYWTQSGQLAHIIDCVDRAQRLAWQEFDSIEGIGEEA